MFPSAISMRQRVNDICLNVFLEVYALLGKHFSSNLPRRLYHYTTADGLLGILDTQSIWATNSGYLNDPTEMTFGIEKILKRAPNFAHTTDRITLSEILKIVESKSQLIQPYIVSFSAKKDLLSQWKGYGEETGGFAIEFDPYQLSTRPYKIHYGRAHQKMIAEELSKIIVKLNGKLRELTLRKSELEFVSKYLSAIVSVFSVLLKHPSYSEEKEWRMFFHATELENSGQQLRTRTRNGELIPYFSVPFHKTITKKPPNQKPTIEEKVKIDPITGIIVGPGRNQDKQFDAVIAYLKNKPFVYKVRKSTIPFHP